MDITTLTAAADKVIHVGGPQPYLVNFEVQSSHQTDLVETTWLRQAALFHRHWLAVLTVLVLLRPDANSPSLTGTFRALQFRRKPPGRRRGQGRRKTRCGLKLVVS